MMKTLEFMGEAIRNHPKKALKNRYERRKIKAYLHLGDFLAEEMA